MKHRAKLEEFYNKFSKQKLSISDMTSEIAHNTDIDLSERTIKDYLYTIRREQKNVISLDNSNLWSVTKNNYTWKGYDKKVKLYSISFIDQLFLYYSKNGYNFSRTRLCNRFELSIKAFNEIQRVFLLYKDANIFSPYTIKNTPDDELKEIMSVQMSKVLRSGEITEQKFQDTISKEYKKVIDDDNKLRLKMESMFHQFSIDLPKLKFNTLNVLNSNKEKEIVVHLADLHIGSKNLEKMKITDDYSYEIAKEKLEIISATINNYKSKAVNVVLLGDLVESLSGMNHPDSWKGLESGMFGFRAISSAYELIINFLNSITNLKQVLGISGNHDRSSKSNQEADTMATDAIFYMLNQYYNKSKITVKYDPSILKESIDGIGYILCHGHLGLHKRPVAEMILNFAVDPKEFQFIVSGHYHTLVIEKGNDTSNGRKVTCPSIFTGNKYSDEEVGVSCKSGFLVTYKDYFNSPVMTVHNC